MSVTDFLRMYYFSFRKSVNEPGRVVILADLL